MVSVLMSNARYILRATAAVALMVLLAACGGGGSTTGAGNTSGQGTLAVQLTDTPAGVSAVNVDIVGLQIKPSGSSVRTLGFAGKTVNLMSLKSAKELMVAAQVPAGSYEYIQVSLDQSGSSVVVDNQRKPLTIPSQEIKVLGGFDVRANGTTTLLLDFNADASLVQAGNGTWLLKPVILQANVTNS